VNFGFDNKEEVTDDPFYPPQDLLTKTKLTLTNLDAFLPRQPDSAVPSLAGAPDVIDRSSSMIMMTQCARWIEFWTAQIGLRQANLVVLKASVKWMEEYVRFAHKGKRDKLTEEQFKFLQQAEYQAMLIEAEISRLESLKEIQSAAFKTASRQLTGNINPL
jgi:hypothetical protein